MTVSVNALLRAVTPRTRVVFVCNPGNPTETRIANAEVLRLRAGLPDRVLLIVDQAYGEFDNQDNAPVFALTPEEVFDLAIRADHDQAEAIVLSCTDMRSVEAVARIEKRLGKPVVTSNQAMIFCLMRDLGLARHAAMPGQLFDLV